MSKGFIESILQDILLAGAVEASRNKDGKPDPYKAAGIATGFGRSSLEDQMRLATMLGAEGAFDSSEIDNCEPTDLNSDNTCVASLKYDWRDTDIGDEYNIFPEDYDSEDEFIAAVEEAEALSISSFDTLLETFQSSEQVISPCENAEPISKEKEVKKYLYEKYGEAFPNVFSKDYQNQSFYDMGSRASKRNNSIEAPFVLLYDLVSYCNTEGLGIFDLLLDGYSKKCLDACKKHLPKVLTVIDSIKCNEIDLEAILGFAEKVASYLGDISASQKILSIITKKYQEHIHDEQVIEFCIEIVELLTDGSIKSPFDSKIRFLTLCCTVVDNLKSKKCYQKAIERTYAENEAQQLVFRFRPADTKALKYWDVGDDFMDDFVYDMLTSKDANVVCHTFAILRNENALSARQKEWVSQGFHHLLRYASDGCGEDEVYENYASDPIFKKTLLSSEKYLGEIIGHLLAMTISKHDMTLHRDLMQQYDKHIRFSNKKSAFVNCLNQKLEYEYIDPFCDSAEMFSDYIEIANNLKTIVSEGSAKVTGNHIKRLCLDIETAYNSFVEKHKQRSLAEIRLNELLKKLLLLLKKVDEGTYWKSKSIAKGSLKYVFKYPNGKNGDINMFLASKCGTVIQEDAITRSSLIEIKNRDYFPLLIHHYGNDTTLNDGIYHYLRNEHYFYQALDIISEIENFNTHLLRDNDFTLEIPQEAWLKIRSSQQKYNSGIIAQREEIYQALAKAGLLSAKWVSEYQVFTIANSLYPDAIYQYHSEWLGQQSLDIFIPSISVGIEYQGQQHYQAVEHFGGEDKLRERKKLDARKKRLCKENGIKLVEIKHTDEISVDLIKNRIESVLLK